VWHYRTRHPFVASGQTKRTFNYNKAIDGFYQILWGLFKKLVIADSCAQYANSIFGQYESMNSATLLLGAFILPSRFMVIFRAIRISRLVPQNCLVSICSGISTIPIFQGILQSSGAVGTFHFLLGFATICTFHSAEAKAGCRPKLGIPLLFSSSADSGMCQLDLYCLGALNALYFLPLLISGKNRTNIEIVAKGRLFPTLREPAASSLLLR
jgi:hypothetical protein